MADEPDRSRVGGAPRDATGLEWEVFVREDGDAPLHHVGSVTAPTAALARELADRLFARYAADVWLCAAADVHRFSTHDLDDAAHADGGTANASTRPR